MGRKTRQTTPITTPPTDAIAALEAATSKANKAISELREATREAHEAIQAAKAWNERALQRVAEEFDSHAAGIINERTEKILTQLGDRLDADLGVVQRTCARWDSEMEDKAKYANDCVDSMQGWLAAFGKLADELEREIMASNPTDSYVQRVPDRVFKEARAKYRALLGIKPSHLLQPPRRAERAKSSEA